MDDWVMFDDMVGFVGLLSGNTIILDSSLWIQIN